jgi:hypothetical protein
MGYRGTEGSRTPADWHGQRSGRPRSYSARAAIEPPDGGSGARGGTGASTGASTGDGAGDDAEYGTGGWAADHREAAYDDGGTHGHGATSRGPARGFPPAPGQPDPVYPPDGYDAWSDSARAPGAHAGAYQGHQEQWSPPAGREWDSPVAGAAWDSPAADGAWSSPAAGGHGDVPAAGGHGDVPAAGGHGDVPAAGGHGDVPAAGGPWDAAPVGQREPAGEQSEHWDQSERWDAGERWDSEEGGAQPWGEGSGHWDAPYGHWDENGEWHSPSEHDSDDGNAQEGNGRHASGYDRADFAIAGRDADQRAGQDADKYPGEYPDEYAGRWESADYPAYGGFPDEPEPAGEENTGRRSRRHRGGHGRKAMATPAADAGPSGSAVPGRGRGAARRSARGSRARAIGLASAAVVVVAALAAVAYTLLNGHGRHSSATGGAAAPRLPSPTTSGSLGTSGASKLGKWGYITSRATDAAPLTVAELYPAQFLINGSSFARTTDRADTNCNQALFGTQLQAAARVYGCSQVVRASYISSSQTMMGTIGVVNLSSANDAAKAGNASGATDFVTPLNGKTGPTRNLSQGTGVVQAEFKGHYLILIWAEFANLKAPSTTAQRTQLEQFASGIISGSANIALSNRMVSGRPEVTGTP